MSVIDRVAAVCKCRFAHPEGLLESAATHWENGGQLLIAAGPGDDHRIVEISDNEDPQGFLDELLAPRYGLDEWPDEDDRFSAFVVWADGFVEHLTGLACWRHGVIVAE